MKHFNKVTCFLIITFCLSCNNEKNQIKQESVILKDILFEIVTDKQFYPLTPPPPATPSVEVKFKDGTTLKTRNDLYTLEYEKFIEKLDTDRFVIGIEDSTISIKNSGLISERLKESGYADLIDLLNSKDFKTQIPIDTSQIKKIDKYEIIIRSKVFPKGFNFREYKGFDLTYYFYGNVSFSRAFIRASGDYGFMIYRRECGFECDQDYILIIKRLKDKWKIINKIYAR